jgi:hypothetical protein
MRSLEYWNQESGILNEELELFVVNLDQCTPITT